MGKGVAAIAEQALEHCTEKALLPSRLQRQQPLFLQSILTGPESSGDVLIKASAQKAVANRGGTAKLELSSPGDIPGDEGFFI